MRNHTTTIEEALEARMEDTLSFTYVIDDGTHAHIFSGFAVTHAILSVALLMASYEWHGRSLVASMLFSSMPNNPRAITSWVKRP